jgi:hypothetical protein
MLNTSYVVYNSPSEMRHLDLNTVEPPFVSMPAYLYGGEPFPVPQFFCGGVDSPAVIDPTQQYFFPNMRDEHPQGNFSRFAYPYCPNGYCLGNQTRGYKTAPVCCTNDQPEGMAPTRFYSWKHTSPYYVDNTAYKLSRTTQRL